MATNPAVCSKAGLVELLGQECYDEYFDEAVGGDSIMQDLGDIIENICIMESIVDELLLVA